MDPAKLVLLENLLRFPAHSSQVVKDASVLTCGCLVSEAQFVQSQSSKCPVCLEPAILSKPVEPLRQLYSLIQQFSSELANQLNRRPSLKRSIGLGPEFRQEAESTNLVGLFYKYAKEENLKTARKSSQSKLLLIPIPQTQLSANQVVAQSADSKHSLKFAESSIISSSPEEKFINNTTIERQKSIHTQQSSEHEYSEDTSRMNMLMGLSEREEYNFSRCFPFHRKLSTFQTQQNKFMMKPRTFMTKSTKFCCSDIVSRHDPTTNAERTTFVLITEKKWELHELVSGGKPRLIACGKSNGEYGPLPADVKVPKERGLVIRNDFSGKEKGDENSDDLYLRLKSWVQLYCCLSERFLVISGTQGVVRVLNVDPAVGEVGSPVYTYMTNFPIRCIAIAPSENLIACGITALERISSKQQPFIILHKLDFDNGLFVKMSPITITVPFRDPLKMLSFNASSTHLLACTVYEMRYFIIKLRREDSLDYSKPRLIWSDMRMTKLPGKKRRGTNEDDILNEMDDSYVHNTDDDQMLDNEGITSVKFGLPFTNTLVLTSSSLKNRPPIVLKLDGPSIDHSQRLPRVPSSNFYQDVLLHVSATRLIDSDDEKANIDDVEVLMKVPEVGSLIYNVEISPRGDGMVFVDKLGKLYLVSTNMQLSHSSLVSSRRRVVLLGESADAYRYSEATSVRFSSDGGKIYAVDRRGLVQVFDFTKGIPGEDPEVIKCKIISV